MHYVIKIGEIALKSGNRRYFERALKKNITRRLSGIPHTITGRQGRYFLQTEAGAAEKIEEALSTTFGITGYAPVITAPKKLPDIDTAAVETARKIRSRFPGGRFKIEARRSDKGFPLSSYEIACRLGDLLRREFPDIVVDVHEPDWVLHVEIREKALLFGPVSKGPGGLPVGTAGRGTLLLSGGIDSPVAGYRMAKRGLKLEAVYFHTYPFTSDEAREKVITLARTLSPYTAGLDLWIVDFTPLQLKIKEHCGEREVTLIMRACMMKIAEIITLRQGGLCLITGEALSQVASQTVESIRFTGSIPGLPVLRPLVGLDKEEIIDQAHRIGTFDISVLPYDDCCTLFSPDRPLIRPDFDAMREVFEGLPFAGMFEEAASTAERIEL
ncbi:MAG: tRNA uracil 4-sulfurtransferase ThiI [Spirochaetia bacterium]